MQRPDTRYARSPEGVYIAYQTFGEGPLDLVWQLGWVGNVDLIWESQQFGTLFRHLASFSRVILHDRRGTGLSSRNVPAPNLELRVADLLTVLDAVGAERPVLAGMLEDGAPNALLAATHPERVHSLVWDGPQVRSLWAEDYPWGARPDYAEADLRALDFWGTSQYGEAWKAAEAVGGHLVSEHEAEEVARLSRHTATPDVARELARIWYETDIRGVLGSVHAPALLMADEDMPEEAEYVASLMSSAKVEVLPASAGPNDTAELIRKFTGSERPSRSVESVLATTVFTDIVGSTNKQAQLGDHGWKQLIQAHHSIIRGLLVEWRGVENDTAGDGFYATFDAPARAIRCARQIISRVRPLGIEVRVGIHAGECEIVDGKLTGIAVTIGSRIASKASASEVLISQTVKDLVAGSGLAFEDAGHHELQGVPGRWRLYRVA